MCEQRSGRGCGQTAHLLSMPLAFCLTYEALAQPHRLLARSHALLVRRVGLLRSEERALVGVAIALSEAITAVITPAAVCRIPRAWDAADLGRLTSWPLLAACCFVRCCRSHALKHKSRLRRVRLVD